MCDNLAERTGGAIIGAGGVGIAVVHSSDGSTRVSTSNNRSKTLREDVGNAFCRPIVIENNFQTSPEEIGDLGVLSLGVANAVDVFGLMADGTPANNFIRVMQICFWASSGSTILFADSSGSPRSYVPLSTYNSGEYVCAFIGHGGTLVQIGS